MLQKLTCSELPELPDSRTMYILEPRTNEALYAERTDRNIGWITRANQNMLRRCTIGVAGCGGMGGLLSAHLARLGIGEVRMADSEVFDVSNINRQFAASRTTVGKSKGLETGRMIREVADDLRLVIYPQGITPETVDDFLDGCEAVCDEIEFWAIGARILLHQRAREHGVPIFNCCTVGFGSRLFLFRPDSVPIESLMSLTLEEAQSMQQRIQNRSASPEEMRHVMQCMIRTLVPNLPTYCEDGRDRDAVIKRLLEEGKASIIATNPPLAAGFVADHLLLYLLNKATLRNTVRIPEPPGYLYLDVATMQAKVMEE